MTFAQRRWRNASITILVAIALVFLHRAYDASLNQVAYLSGWLLFGTILFLTLYNGRKKVSMVPLGRNAIWLQFHIYLGLLAVVVFFIHVGWSVPNGWLEGILAAMFIGVAGSGIIGLYLSRRLARLLTRRGEEVIFERIPMFVTQLREQAEAVVTEAAKETGSSTLSDYYATSLATFFARPRNYFAHLIQSRRSLFSALNSITNMERYLNDPEQAYSAQLRDLVTKKDELDYHHALQMTLKGWLFVHLPLTYGMVILAVLHLVLAYAFRGGA